MSMWTGNKVEMINHSPSPIIQPRLKDVTKRGRYNGYSKIVSCLSDQAATPRFELTEQNARLQLFATMRCFELG
jgi:hypothetical protein